MTLPVWDKFWAEEPDMDTKHQLHMLEKLRIACTPPWKNWQGVA